MVKRIRKVVKNRAVRQSKKIVVVGTEGKNQTETFYLRNLEKKLKEYHFIFAEGNETDPVNIVKKTIGRANKEDISIQEGDMAVSIFDLDLDKSKVDKLKKAMSLAREKGHCVVTSNPCFEIWLLEHFGYTTRPFNSSDEAVQELRKVMPEYQKNSFDFDVLFPMTNEAIVNCTNLDKHHGASAENIVNPFCNPRTDFYKLVKKMLRDAQCS